MIKVVGGAARRGPQSPLSVFLQDINHCHAALFLRQPRSETGPPAPAESHFCRRGNQSRPPAKASAAEEAAGLKKCVYGSAFGAAGAERTHIFQPSVRRVTSQTDKDTLLKTC